MQSYFAEGKFTRDLLSSIVVFLVALPLCMGISIAAGLPPASGLITGIVGGLVVGFCAGSPLSVSGPTIAHAVLLFELARGSGVEILGPVIIFAGLIQVVGGLCRAGIWFRMTSPAVVTGMLSGIGLLIIASQAHVMLDAKPLVHGTENIAAFPAAVLNSLQSNGWIAGSVGLATIVVFFLWDKFKPKQIKMLPGALIAVVTVTAVTQVLGLQIKHVELPENLADAVRFVSFSSFDTYLNPEILIAALTLAFLSSAETLLSAVAVDRMHNGIRANYNRELAAQGIGNIVCGVIGALPLAGVIVRSAANVQAGAATRVSAIMHGGWMLVFVALAPWLLRMTPIACLAGVLVYTGFKMVNIKQIRELGAYGYGSIVVCVATMFTILATDLLAGVLVGFALSLFRLSLRSSRLRLDLQQDESAKRAHLDLSGSATFLNVPAVAKTLEQVPPHFDLYLVLDRLHHVDHACLELFRDWAANAQKHGAQLIVDWKELNLRTEGTPTS